MLGSAGVLARICGGPERPRTRNYAAKIIKKVCFANVYVMFLHNLFYLFAKKGLPLQRN